MTTRSSHSALAVLALFASAALLSGCLGSEQQVSLQDAPKPITCKPGKDCEAKWARANAWITEHSKYKVEAKSDSMIETAGPSTFETDPSPSYKVRKLAIGAEQYAIEFSGECDSMFACTPALPTAQADFTEAVMAAEAAPPSPPEKKKKKATHTASQS